MSIQPKIIRLTQDKWMFLTVLFLIGLVLYSITLNVGFFSDDYGFIEEIQKHNWDSFGRNFGDKFFIPVSHTFGFLLYKTTFGSAVLMHLVQVIIHVLVSFQLYLLIKELGVRLDKTSKAIQLGALAAVIFLVHPFQTEAVVWLAAKSYGYGLLFSLLSIRYLFKSGKYDLLKSLAFLFVAIHCKESAYFIPLTILALCTLLKIKIQKKWFIGWGILILISVLLRYAALGEWVGGYGSEVHGQYHPMILLFTLLGYGIKFLSIYKMENKELFEIWIFAAIPVLLTICISIYKTNHLKKVIYWSLLLFTLLIPVLNLELTSISSVSTDRYSYFALTAVSFGLAYFLLGVSSKFSKVLTPIVLIALVGLNFYYQTCWRGSAEVRDQYLSQVVANVAGGENVMIVNIPDRAYGTYCLKNAPEDYMRIQGVNCNIEFYIQQNLTNKITGIDLLKTCQECPIWLRNYPDLSNVGRVFFNESWLTEFDKVFIYQEGKLIRITEDYLKTVSLQSE
ncbi:MAG: hypothetical protein ACI8Q1_000664 [Parvicella sp.]|jgi:hypothetical protein